MSHWVDCLYSAEINLFIIFFCYLTDDITNDKHRQKTDAVWIWPLIVTFIIYWIVGILAVKDLTLDFFPVIASNNVTCGINSNVLDKPYELFLDSRTCYYVTANGPKDSEKDFSHIFCDGKSVSIFL